MFSGVGVGGLFDGDYLHRPLAARVKEAGRHDRCDLTPPPQHVGASLSLQLDVIHSPSHTMGYKCVYIPCLNNLSIHFCTMHILGWLDKEIVVWSNELIKMNFANQNPYSKGLININNLNCSYQN